MVLTTHGHIHLHVVIRTRHIEASLHGSRRALVDLRYLGEKTPLRSAVRTTSDSTSRFCMGWPQGTDRYWCGAKDQGDVWFVNKPVSNDLHPTMKPVELIERAIRNSSKSRDIVLDVFGGSGSTIVACEKTGRQGRMIEVDPIFVDVAIRRWEQYSGHPVRLGRDGRTFAEVSEQRQLMYP